MSPQAPTCQAPVGRAARFGYFLILSPDRYGVRSASWVPVSPPRLKLGFHQVGRVIQSGSFLAAVIVGTMVL
ncbi:hypothetical protein C2142_36770 [Streptomyces sp. CB01881]|nr:hypothetical protein C2142_36770 [Streptomyces sp. CB01881]